MDRNPNNSENKNVILNFIKKSIYYIQKQYNIYFKDLSKNLYKYLLFALLISSIIVCTFFYSREITIKRVRDKDCEMIYGFIDFLMSNKKYYVYDDISRDFQQILHPLYPSKSYQKIPYIGVSLWANKNIIFSNHYQLSGRKYDEILMLANNDKRFIIKKYNKPLDELVIVFFRPELKYNLDLFYSRNVIKNILNFPVMFFTFISMAVDPDIMEISFKKIYSLGKIPFIFTFIVILGLNLFYNILIRKQHKKNLRDFQYKENAKIYEKYFTESRALNYQIWQKDYNRVKEPYGTNNYKINNITLWLGNNNLPDELNDKMYNDIDQFIKNECSYFHQKYNVLKSNSIFLNNELENNLHMFSRHFIWSDYLTDNFIDDALRRLANATEIFLKLLYENVAKSSVETLVVSSTKRVHVKEKVELIIKKYNIESLIKDEVKYHIIDLLSNKEKFNRNKQEPTAYSYYVFWLLPIFILNDAKCQSYIEPIIRAYKLNNNLIRYIERIIKLRNKYSHARTDIDNSKRQDIRDWLFRLMSVYFSISKAYENFEIYIK